MRLSRLKPREYHNQLKHDRRENKYIPKYIDKSRMGENVLIYDSQLAHISGFEYLEHLNRYRQSMFESGKSGLTRNRKLTKENNIAYSGVITFGKEAQEIVGKDRERLNALYANIVKRICREYGTGPISIVAHYDEQAPHAHFVLRMMKRDATLLDLKQKDMKHIQDIAGEVCKEMGFDISRGKSKDERIKDGEPMHTYVHRSVRELHNSLPNAIEEKENLLKELEEEISNLTARIKSLNEEIKSLEEQQDKRIKDIQDKERLILKAQRQLDELVKAGKEESEKAQKLIKRIETYERRQENYRREISELEREISEKRKSLIESENAIARNREKIERSERIEKELKGAVTAVKKLGENLGTIKEKLPEKQGDFLEKVIDRATADIDHPIIDVLLNSFYSDDVRDIIR